MAEKKKVGIARHWTIVDGKRVELKPAELFRITKGKGGAGKKRRKSA
ncbi:MAG: hypothetical protein M5U25_02725 [Planctomycetota bacterium]|nr:hypothetical protein [Planctomycetota bacterium]